MTLTVQFLPAGKGDAILLEWGDPGARRKALVDLGTGPTGREFAARLRALPPAEREFELLVVTHVDNDHIGGVLSCFVDPATRVEDWVFHDVWFNGLPHLDGGTAPRPGSEPGLEIMGVAEGEELAQWLAGRPWNEQFGRGPAIRDGDPTRFELPGHLSITVLGPTPDRLARLKSIWPALVASELTEPVPDVQAPPGLEAYGAQPPPTITSLDDLAELADAPFRRDPSASNATSITLLVEWGGRRILLTGDALASDLTAGLTALQEEGRVELDLVKLPHHGSRNNLDRALASKIACPHWVVTSDGTGQQQHPDPEAIARVLVYGGPGLRMLGFNVASPQSLLWDQPAWREIGGYGTRYGDEAEGLTYTFDGC